MTIIHVLMDNRHPVKTMAWILVIYFVPVVGIVFYLLIGINTRREKLVSGRSMNQLTRRSMLEFVEQGNTPLPEERRTLINMFVNQNSALPFKVATTDIFTDGSSYFLSLVSDIAHATDHIHIDMYILENDPLGMLISDILIDKSRQGVEVRIIIDDVGCWNVPSRFIERLREEGIEVRTFLPVHFITFASKVNYRNHRKMIVIDGKVGYIGGMNIALRYIKGTATMPWRDTMVRITGSVVCSLQRAFLIDWYFVDRTLISDRKYYPAVDVQPADSNSIAQIVTSGPDTPNPEIMQGYVQIIHEARRYIYIESPYFLPTEPVLFALKAAASAGVDVRIICPMRSDACFVEWAGRSYLREAVEAGVNVYLYTEGFIHSKMLVSDDYVSTCGSTNVDFRSFENNFEANVFFYSTDIALRMKQMFADDQRRSRLLSDFSSRMHPTFFHRLWESLIRLLSPLM